MPGNILIGPGTLLDSLDECIRKALACGALQPIETVQVVVEDSDVRFLVRQVSSLRRKEADKHSHTTANRNRAAPANPFLPPEPELTVAEISPTHVAVLNKFNVLQRHLLLVTRQFEHQETLLDQQDFCALLACMDQYESLGFYNGGVSAGASQTHKHLQMVPLPFAEEAAPVPMEPLLKGPGPRCDGLPFPHSFRRLSGSTTKRLEERVAEAQSLYMDMLAELGIGAMTQGGKLWQSGPYNLLIAHDWMLAVPRKEEFFLGVSINALGFAGSLFVKDPDQMALVRREGPMRILQAVAGIV